MTSITEIIEGTLEWCNSIRVEKGMDILTELPKGKMNDGRSCPCGTATGLSVGTYFYHQLDEDGNYLTEDPVKLPLVVEQFVKKFDKGLIPDLVEGSI